MVVVNSYEEIVEKLYDEDIYKECRSGVVNFFINNNVVCTIQTSKKIRKASKSTGIMVNVFTCFA